MLEAQLWLKMNEVAVMRESSSNILEKMGSSRERPGPTLLMLVGILSQKTSGL